MSNFAEMNAEYEKWFSHKPARSCVAVKALPKGVPVEIECKHGTILLWDRSLRGPGESAVEVLLRLMF